MKKKNLLKTIPKFKNASEEHEFWQTHDTTDYVDYSQNRVQIEFDASVEEPVKMISLRIPRDMLNQLRAMAVKRDIPYQSLIKMILADRLASS